MEEVANDIIEPFHAGLTSDVLPEAESNIMADSSQTGVSPRSVLSATESTIDTGSKKAKQSWFVIIATYGQEKKGVDYLTKRGISTFSPTITRMKVIDGERKPVTEYILPNLFFAQSTVRELQPIVERNPEAPYLRFYCRYFNQSGERRREIITVPQVQMDSFMKICATKDANIRICNEVIHKFEKGEYVRVIGGPFEGVQGRVVRIFGKQRVGIVIDNILTVMTSFVPTEYLEKVEEE